MGQRTAVGVAATAPNVTEVVTRGSIDLAIGTGRADSATRALIRPPEGAYSFAAAMTPVFRAFVAGTFSACALPGPVSGRIDCPLSCQATSI